MPILSGSASGRSRFTSIGSLIGLFLTVLVSFSPTSAHATTDVAVRMSGRILLQVEQHGEAWYVNPADLLRYYLARKEDAFQIMRQLGIGITNANLARIPEAGQRVAPGNEAFVESVKGKIFLQVEANGEAWYVDPSNGIRYYLGRPDDALRVMRERGVGITDDNLGLIQPDVTLEGYRAGDIGEDDNTLTPARFTIVNHGSLTHALSEFSVVETGTDGFLPAGWSEAKIFRFSETDGNDDSLGGGLAVTGFVSNSLSAEEEDLLDQMGYVWDALPDDWMVTSPSVPVGAQLFGLNGTPYEYASPEFIATCGQTRSDAPWCGSFNYFLY